MGIMIEGQEKWKTRYDLICACSRNGESFISQTAEQRFRGYVWVIVGSAEPS
jgi:hypothetical protein